jgi:hypothetical protein
VKGFGILRAYAQVFATDSPENRPALTLDAKAALVREFTAQDLEKVADHPHSQASQRKKLQRAGAKFLQVKTMHAKNSKEEAQQQNRLLGDLGHSGAATHKRQEVAKNRSKRSATFPVGKKKLRVSPFRPRSPDEKSRRPCSLTDFV